MAAAAEEKKGDKNPPKEENSASPEAELESMAPEEMPPEEPIEPEDPLLTLQRSQRDEIKIWIQAESHKSLPAELKTHEKFFYWLALQARLIVAWFWYWEADRYFNRSFWFLKIKNSYYFSILLWFGRLRKYEHFTKGVFSPASIRRNFLIFLKHFLSILPLLLGEVSLWIRPHMDRLGQWVSQKIEYLQEQLSPANLRLMWGKLGIEVQEGMARFGYLSFPKKILFIIYYFTPASVVIGLCLMLLHFLFFSTEALKPLDIFGDRNLATVRKMEDPPVTEFLIEFKGLLLGVAQDKERNPPSMLAVDMLLEVRSKASRSEVNDNFIKLKAGVVEILNYRRPEELQTSEGKLKIKKELMRFFNKRLKKGEIMDLYFVNFIMH